MQGWHFWVDRGGTFTDVVALSPDGVLASRKLLSHNPQRYKDAAVQAIREYLQPCGEPSGTGQSHRAQAACIDSVRMGTTVATNALLERRGARTALVITGGFRDALRIAYQNRPNIFALDIQLPEMLYHEVIEANERVSAHGSIVRRLDTEQLRGDLEDVHRQGTTSVAIVFLHGYRFPDHEKQAATLARQVGFEQVSVSHETSPLMKLVARGDTTLVDAYLSPVLQEYIHQVRSGLMQELGATPLLFMQSHGGLAEAQHFHGKDSILSGPAGGVVGMVETATAAGMKQLIGFDMGGTSTDVTLFDGVLERTSSAEVAGVRVTAPMLRIHTVAAGGGSLLQFESGRLQVGPQSAGASPGPACYRNGGPLTLTDANVLLGRVLPDYFPKVFGPQGKDGIDTQVVRAMFLDLAAHVSRSSRQEWSPERLANGFLQIAVERMANAIKQISVQRGHEVSNFTLCCFGGAGGQHACQVAESLGMQRIYIHPLAGVLSAYGMGLADLRTLRYHAVEADLAEECMPGLRHQLQAMQQQAVENLQAQGVPEQRIRFERRVLLKVTGSDTTLKLTWQTSAKDLMHQFHQQHLERFGFRAAEAALTVESLELEAIGQSLRAPQSRHPQPQATLRLDCKNYVWFGDQMERTPVYQRVSLPADACIHGPAIVVEEYGCTVVEPHWQAQADSTGALLLSRSEPPSMRPRPDPSAELLACDPIRLEVFNNLFMHIAEEMGVVLQNTAHSVNIKERLDFSCAVFDATGELIANAPHMPVHLGSMGESIRTVLTQRSEPMRPGDVYMLNAPYNGGTHLPDITVVTPVFGADGQTLEFTVACRAHHADIGGTTPGSMPASSRYIDQEGVLFDNVLLVRGGQLREAVIREKLAAGPYPARNPDQNIADLKAQIAANAKGIGEIENMVQRFGLPVVHAYMQHIQDNAQQCVEEAIGRLRNGHSRVELDGGEVIAVRVTVDQERKRATVDFTGSSGLSPGNFNAPASIARAAVLYVFRSLVRQDIPLNAGCLKPLDIILPPNSLVNPRAPAAVVAGNVETSQCMTDALLAALGACAGSQGTMNNFTFGNDRVQYYETICGGAGAGPGFDGASAVQTHMTNSRLTDPEVLEWRFPVRINEFSLRRNSGGKGQFHGGDGVRRDVLFLEDMQAGILSNRRRVAPAGLGGGGNGSCGRNSVVRTSGGVEELPATAEVVLRAGDRFLIETPGGGGFGKEGPQAT